MLFLCRSVSNLFGESRFFLWLVIWLTMISFPSIAQSVDSLWIDSDKHISISSYYPGPFRGLVIRDSCGSNLDSIADERVFSFSVCDILGDERKEIIVETIEGRMMSVYPILLSIYEFNSSQLRKVFDFPSRHLFLAGKNQVECFRNDFDFSEKGAVQIRNLTLVPGCIDTTVYTPDSRVPIIKGQRFRFTYDVPKSVFIPVN